MIPKLVIGFATALLSAALAQADAASIAGPLAGGEDGAAAATGVPTRAPELLQFVSAPFPPEAEAAGASGSVVLSIVIAEDGAVTSLKVIDPGPHPSFAPAAEAAVRQFKFRPAEIDGKPAPVEIEYRYDFVLKRAPPAAPLEAPVLLSGRVIERGTRTPISGAAIEAGGVTAETDADGRFALRGLTPGEVKVRVVSPEHEPLEVKEVIAADRAVEVEYRLTRRHYDPYEAVVRGERPRREVSVKTIEPEEVRTVAGTQGDVIGVVQNLPGVAGSPFGIGLLVVRGSEPSDSAVFYDGIPIPLVFHFGSLTSVISSDVIEGLDFYPGNFGTRFGRATAARRCPDAGGGARLRVPTAAVLALLRRAGEHRHRRLVRRGRRGHHGREGDGGLARAWRLDRGGVAAPPRRAAGRRPPGRLRLPARDRARVDRSARDALLGSAPRDDPLGSGGAVWKGSRARRADGALREPRARPLALVPVCGRREAAAPVGEQRRGDR